MIFIYILLGLIALLAILSFVLPSSYLVEKKRTMPFSAETVYNNVANLQKYQEWNPWQKEEPGAKQVVTGQAGTVGHKYEWAGKKIGIGSLTLLKTVPNQSIDFSLDFIKPFKSHANDNWTFEATGPNECIVTWSNGAPLAAGMPRLIGGMIIGQLKKQFEAGLDNLEALCAKG